MEKVSRVLKAHARGAIVTSLLSNSCGLWTELMQKEDLNQLGFKGNENEDTREQGDKSNR